MIFLWASNLLHHTINSQRSLGNVCRNDKSPTVGRWRTKNTDLHNYQNVKLNRQNKADKMNTSCEHLLQWTRAFSSEKRKYKMKPIQTKNKICNRHNGYFIKDREREQIKQKIRKKKANNHSYFWWFRSKSLKYETNTKSLSVYSKMVHNSFTRVCN